MRRSGRTTNTILQARVGAVLVCPTEAVADHVRRHAKKLGRPDIQVVSADWLRDERWRGTSATELVADHTFYEFDIPQRVWDTFIRVQLYINGRNQPVSSFSAIPEAIRKLVDEAPILCVTRGIPARVSDYPGLPPPSYVEKENARRFVNELAPFISHTWGYDLMSEQNVCTSKITKPLSHAELISLLSRAYEAGRESS